MKLLLVHLSDLHISLETDPLLSRAGAIASVARATVTQPDLILVACTGDVAYSGRFDEYLLATEFFTHLLRELRTHSGRGGATPVVCVAVPGNHDCDLNTSQVVRDQLIDGLLRSASQTIPSEIVTLCADVQRHFNDFVGCIETAPAPDGVRTPLVRVVKVPVGAQSLNVLCLDTAWMSQKPERQGRILYPTDSISALPALTGPTIALLHHPYNWLESVNGKKLRVALEERCNLILTGHEHDPSEYARVSEVGVSTHYVEGGALQYHNDRSHSSFNLIELDTAEGKSRYTRFSWSGDRYTPTTPSGRPQEYGVAPWREIGRPALVALDGFSFRPGFRAVLEDLGVQLTHRARETVKLGELFVWPDFKDLTLVTERPGARIRGDKILDEILSHPVVLITGETGQGRTSLARMLTTRLRADGRLPVLLDRSTSPRPGDEALVAVGRAFCDQYDAVSAEAWRQAPDGVRIVVIDDFDRLPLKVARRHALVRALANAGTHVVLLTHDLSNTIEEVAGGALGAEGLAAPHLQIQEFGLARREELVDRWFALESDDETEPAQLARRMADVKRRLSDVFRREYVPAYPGAVLALIQTFDASTPLNVSRSAYGYYFDILISMSLAKGRTQVEYDLIAAYLGFVAWRMYQSRTSSLDETAFSDCHRDFEARHAIRRDLGRLLDGLVRQEILVSRDGRLRFKYEYYLHYFVARHLRDRITSSEAKDAVGEMARTLHTARSANILLFLAHLSKDPVILDAMLGAETSVYPGVPPATLGPELDYLGDLQTLSGDAQLELAEPDESRRRRLEELDEAAAEQAEADGGRESREEEESIDPVSPVAQLNGALKVVQILGQMVRNFPSLEAEQKRRIVASVCACGLRAMTSVLGVMAANHADLAQAIAREIARHAGAPGREGARRRADRVIVGLSLGATFGLIKHMANSVGSRDLWPTYDVELKEGESNAIDLLLSALHLDHGSSTPVDIIRRVMARLGGRPAVAQVLQALVGEHLTLFEPDIRKRQQLADAAAIRLRSIAGPLPDRRARPAPKKREQ